MCTYLAKRDSTYYFRRPVPEALRPVVGRREWMVSLRTKDRAAAKLQLPLHMQRTDKEIREAEAKLKAGWTAAKPDSSGISAGDLWAMEEDGRAASEEDAAAMMPETVFSERYAGAIAEIEAGAKTPLFALPPDRAVPLLVAQRAVERERDAQWDAAARAFVKSGELAEKLNRKPEAAASPAKPGSPNDAVSLLGMVEAYAVEAGVKVSTLQNWRPRLGTLSSSLGMTMPSA